MTKDGNVKTGADHLASLRDGREVYIDGERVADVTAGIADSRRQDAVIAAQQVLHAPEAAAGQNRAFCFHRKSSTWFR